MHIKKSKSRIFVEPWETGKNKLAENKKCKSKGHKTELIKNELSR